MPSSRATGQGDVLSGSGHDRDQVPRLTMALDDFATARLNFWQHVLREPFVAALDQPALFFACEVLERLARHARSVDHPGRVLEHPPRDLQ